MKKVSSVVLAITLSMLLAIGSGAGCAEEKAKEVLPPQIEITAVTTEKTTNFSQAALDGLIAAMGAQAAYGMALTIRSATMEMAFKISNPNDFEISLDSWMIDVSIEGVPVEHPNLTEKMYVPGETTVLVPRVFAIKQVDIYTVLNMILGKSAAEAMAESGDLFTEITTGTPTWDVDCRANISSEFGDLTQRYQLSWTKS